MKLNILTSLKKMTRKKKLIYFFIILIVFFLIKSVSGLNAAKEAINSMVSTTLIEKKDIEESLTLKAPLEGSESVEVVSKQHYEVLELLVDEGDVVEKDQVLAVLDSETLATEVEQAKDAFDLANYQYQEQMKLKQSEYAEALDILDEARRNHQRIQALFNQGAESKENYEKAQSNLDKLSRDLEKYNVDNGQVLGDASQVKQLEIYQKALKQSEKNYQEAQIKSPIAGTITRVNIKVGRFADDTEDSKPMFVIENLNQLHMKVLVSEYDVGKVREGQAAFVSADILKGEKVEAVVSRISPTGEPKSANSSERVIPTQINITQANPKLIAGITAKAKISIAQAKDCLVVPIECILENEDGDYNLFRMSNDQTIEILKVELGVENDIEVEVKGAGLQEGDKIVISPKSELTEGMKVFELNEQK